VDNPPNCACRSSQVQYSRHLGGKAVFIESPGAGCLALRSSGLVVGNPEATPLWVMSGLRFHNDAFYL
jgi:hypothetical protein